MKRNFVIILPIIILILLSLVLTSCFFENLFSANSSLSEDSVSSETETTPESESQTVSDEVSESLSNPERVELSADEIQSVSEYIETITLYANITDFETIEQVDQNWIATRFFFIAEYADYDDYDNDFQGAYIATIESVQTVAREYVNPDLVLSSDFDYELDETLVKWLPEYGLFTWLGRGLPGSFRKLYPVEAYVVENVINFICIDLQEFWDLGEENPINDIYDEYGITQVGTYNHSTDEFNFSIDVQTQPKYLYKLIPNGEDSYYLISKQKID